MRYITVSNLSFYYDREPVLEGIHYYLDSGEFVTLTGENGAAKSTLIKASLGILKPKIGSVEISKTNVNGKKLRIAYLPQQIASFNAGFPSTVYEFVKSGRYPRKGWFRKLNEHDEQHILKSLESVGMLEHKNQAIGSLSGGQKQRAVIARMFASDPDIFILDEPTTGMDATTKSDFYELMHHSAHHHQKSVLMITHDPEEVSQFADVLTSMGLKGRVTMLDLFQYDFMQRALLAMIAMSLFSPVLGIFLILRRQSLMSDTLSHVSLAGVAFGLFLGISPTLSTMLIVIVAAVFLEYLRTLFKDFMEIGTAILMSTGLALALVLMRGGGKSSMSLDQYLFGSTLTITDEQVLALFVIAFVVLVLTALFLRPMYILTFDEDTAFVDGLPVRTMSILFNVVTGVAIALMIPAAGSLLVSTIMVLPASIALKLGKNFRGVMLIAVIIGFIGMFSGLILSYIADTPASASITLLFVALFLLVNLGSRLRK